MEDQSSTRKAVAPRSEPQSRARKVMWSSAVALIFSSTFLAGLGSVVTWGYDAYRRAVDGHIQEINADAAAIAEIENTLDGLLELKWKTTIALDDELRRAAAGKAATPAAPVLADFRNADNKWDDHHNRLSAALTANVDSRFGVESEDWFGLSNNESCQSQYPFDLLNEDQRQDEKPWSVQYVLEATYHCYDAFKGEVNARLNPSGSDNGKPWAENVAAAQAKDRAWWISRVLRCLLLERMLAVRDYDVRVGLWDALIGAATSRHSLYKPNVERDRVCLKPYRKFTQPATH